MPKKIKKHRADNLYYVTMNLLRGWGACKNSMAAFRRVANWPKNDEVILLNLSLVYEFTCAAQGLVWAANVMRIKKNVTPQEFHAFRVSYFGNSERRAKTFMDLLERRAIRTERLSPRALPRRKK